MCKRAETMQRARRFSVHSVAICILTSPQSNGMSTIFVNTLRRGYLAGADRCAAASVLDQVPN
jgi:hypothetical protein